MSADNQEALATAQHLADNMKLLATEYQAVVRSTTESDEQGQKDRRSLNRKFQKLKSHDLIEGLKKNGLTAVAEKLDELLSACACVFNLVAVSIGVEEAKVLAIDIDGPYVAAVEVLRTEAASQ